MEKVRYKEKEDVIYNYQINLVLSGNPQLEEAISKYLQETLEHHFLENGEKVEFIEILSISQKK